MHNTSYKYMHYQFGTHTYTKIGKKMMKASVHDRNIVKMASHIRYMYFKTLSHVWTMKISDSRFNPQRKFKNVNP